MAILLIGILILGIIIISWLVGIYNILVRLRNQVKNAWSQIDVQLKRRYDLIPNLVETAKGYMQHERETLEGITQARSNAMSSNSMDSRLKNEATLDNAMSKFFLVVENYPDLKANENFLMIQEELTSTENKIAFSRQAYNDSVLFLNNKIEQFPSNLVANSFKFEKMPFYEIENKTEREAPKVSFK